MNPSWERKIGGRWLLRWGCLAAAAGFGFSVLAAPAAAAEAGSAAGKEILRTRSQLQQPAPVAIDSSDQTIHEPLSLSAALSVPIDSGRGYPRGLAYLLWKPRAWPWPSTDARFVFAGIVGDAELTWRGLFSPETDLGFGLGYQTMGRFEEYRRGQIDIGDRMGIARYSGRLFLQQHIVVNFVEIAQVRLTYEPGYAQYYHHDDTAPAFRVAQSGLFQSVKLDLGTGKLKVSNYAPSGWKLNFGAEASFRDDWKPWGPPNAWDSPSEFQKATVTGAYVASTMDDQKLVTTLAGGVGNGLDRLSLHKLGGTLADFPDSHPLHGFYVREIFAEDFGLLNLHYITPILPSQELALHLYLDGAVTRRSDIPDRELHGWAGTGTGVSFKGWWDTQWLVGYGFGINAQRGAGHGGHELFAQMSKEF